MDWDQLGLDRAALVGCVMLVAVTAFRHTPPGPALETQGSGVIPFLCC